jgi:hypothetical protein
MQSQNSTADGQRAYALVEAQSSSLNKRTHPLSRLKDVIAATSDIERDIVLERFGSGAHHLEPSQVGAEPAVQSQSHRGQQHDGDAGLQTVRWQEHDRCRPDAGHLEGLSPATFEEYERRLARKKVVDFETVRTEWPTLKAQLLQNWQDSVDDNAAKIIGAKRQRVTKPTMPNAPALDQFPDIGYRGRPN